jgi:hypothetical protein
MMGLAMVGLSIVLTVVNTVLVLFSPRPRPTGARLPCGVARGSPCSSCLAC